MSYFPHQRYWVSLPNCYRCLYQFRMIHQYPVFLLVVVHHTTGFHNFSLSAPSNCLCWANVAIILLNHCHTFSAHIWMDFGTSGKNDRLFLDIISISRALGTTICQALPGFHAFTGSDYTHLHFTKKRRNVYLKYKWPLCSQIAADFLCCYFFSMCEGIVSVTLKTWTL